MEVSEDCFIRVTTPLQALQRERMNRRLEQATVESRKHLQEIQARLARLKEADRNEFRTLKHRRHIGFVSPYDTDATNPYVICGASINREGSL
jgi:hypothetical protein